VIRPKIISKLLTNGAYGYPQGQRRQHEPLVLMVIHITGNRSTAAANATRGEIGYMNRPIVAGGHYNSAHNYVDRNGLVFQCVPMQYPAWNNGDLLRPDMTNEGVQRLVRGSAKGINANELCYREVECTGYPGSFPVTEAQLNAVAYLIARDALKTGLPITRNTVLTHADLNSVNRANCAFPPGKREAQMAHLIDLARQWKQELKDPQPDPEPDPDPEPTPDPCQECNDALLAAQGESENLRGQIDDLVADIRARLDEQAPPVVEPPA
jgi:hypothetical protein